MLVDSHCHLNFDQLLDNLDFVLKDSKDHLIEYLNLISVQNSDFEAVKRICAKNTNLGYTVGIHPLYVLEEKIDTEYMSKFFDDVNCIGIGETGLDYYKGEDFKDKQKNYFIEQIKLAQEFDLPIVVHARNADRDTVKILHDLYSKKSFRGVIHCFTASEYLAKAALEIDFYISASGIITYDNTKELKRIFSQVIPNNRLLVETDSPFLTPSEAESKLKMNIPSNVRFVAKELARLKNIGFEEVANITTENFYRLFSKAKSGR